jgi:hypothetical protein
VSNAVIAACTPGAPLLNYDAPATTTGATPLRTRTGTGATPTSTSGSKPTSGASEGNRLRTLPLVVVEGMVLGLMVLGAALF